MSPFHRFTLMLVAIVFLVSACAPTATPTPVLATATSLPPTSTSTPSISTPTPKQPASGVVIGVTNAPKLQKIASLDLPGSRLSSILFTPDHRTMLSGDMNGEVLIWERETWKKTTFLAAQSDFKSDEDGKFAYFGTLALSPTGKMIVSAEANGKVKGQDWDGKELLAFSLGDRVYGTAISPDGKYLAAGGYGKKLMVVDLKTNQPVADLSNDYEYISALLFSPDGKTLLASYERPGNVMKIWDTVTWKETASFSHTSERFDYHDILFTPDSKFLVIASTRNDIEFLDLETKQVVKKLQGHSNAPYQMAFSPDGSLLASASDDMSVRLWDVKTGQPVLVLRNQHEVGSVAFSPDGTLLAFGVWGEGLQIWAAPK